MRVTVRKRRAVKRRRPLCLPSSHAHGTRPRSFCSALQISHGSILNMFCQSNTFQILIALILYKACRRLSSSDIIFLFPLKRKTCCWLQAPAQVSSVPSWLLRGSSNYSRCAIQCHIFLLWPCLGKHAPYIKRTTRELLFKCAWINKVYLKPEDLLAYSHSNPVEIPLVLSYPRLPLRTHEEENNLSFNFFPADLCLIPYWKQDS